MQDMMNQPCDLPDPDLVLLALWHSAVRSAVSVYALVGWDANIRGMLGLSDESAREVGQERGWVNPPDYIEWRAYRHHFEHVVEFETVSFPMREALPKVNPHHRYGLDETYMGNGEEYGFRTLPDDNAVKRFEQFVYGLGHAIHDWYRQERQKADKEAEEWFDPLKVQERKSDHVPFRVDDAITHCAPRLVERLLTRLTRDIVLGAASSRSLAGFRYEIKRAIRRTGALEARFKLDWLNMEPDTHAIVLLNWQDCVEARLEALDKWMRDAGGGSKSKAYQYTVDMDRYFEILADVYAERDVRLDHFITFCYNEFTRPITSRLHNET